MECNMELKYFVNKARQKWKNNSHVNLIFNVWFNGNTKYKELQKNSKLSNICDDNYLLLANKSEVKKLTKV